MSTKFLIILISGLIGLIFVLNKKKPLKVIFWFSIGFMFIRPLSFGDYVFNLSLFLTVIVLFLNPKIIFSPNSFKEWRLWYLVLLIGFINAITFQQSSLWFIGQDVLSKSFDWVLKFLVVIFVASAVTYFVKTKEDLNKLMYLFLLNCFIFSFTSTIAYFGFYDGIIIYGADSLRIFQDLNNDIIYSEIYGISYSNLVLFVSSCGIVFLPYLKWKAWKKYLLMLLIIFSVIISLKRSAFIILILSILYYLIIERKKGNNIWILFVPIIIILIGTTYFDLIYKRFSGALNSIKGTGAVDSSTNIRLSRINLALQTFLDAPIFGKGAGYLSFVHNGFFEILANLGLTGLILFKPLIRPLKKLKSSFYNPWAISLILLMLTLVSFEAAINRVEIMYFVGLLYGGYMVSKKLNKSHSYE
ncbi:O-antigen ligase family protein [Flavobacteriaceae bacterium]|nr:O-antigen ligase family protein [Flavobacteriaceae bacterium]